MNSLKRIDILFFSYFSITTLILLLSWNRSVIFVNLLFTRAIIIFGTIALIYFNSNYKHTLVSLIRNTYPIILSGYFYSETVFYNKLFFNNFDPLLADIDAFLFGFQPSLKFSTYFSSIVFSEIMYFGYFSFYLLISAFILYVFFKKKTFFTEAVFLLSASLYAFYFIFGLFPSAGPQFYFSPSDRILPNAIFFDKVMHYIQQSAEQPTGAFPSSHVGVSLIILIISRKRIPLFFKIAYPFVVILILSTVYIKAHYLIDIIGAIVIVPFILYLSNVLYSIGNKFTHFPH